MHHDFKLALGEWPKAFYDAMKFYDEINEELSPRSISFTGHSLGGALAQLVGITINEARGNAPKFPVICFNAPQMGYLIKYNKFKEEKSNINYCIDNISKTLMVHKGNSRSLLAKSNLTSKVLGSLSDVFKNTKSLYSHIISYKDLKVTFDYNQPAFNAVYDLLTNDMQVNIKNKSLFNKINYKENILNFERKYNYIFNFNSLFDVVNTVGIPLGSNLAIDIDAKENFSYYQARLRCELRALVTQFEDYFSYNDLKYNFIKNHEKVYKYSYAKVKEKLNCTANLKDYIGHASLDAIDIFKLLPGILSPSKSSYSKAYISDLQYMAENQHSIINLGNVILNNKELAEIQIGKNLIDLPNKLKKYQQNSFIITSNDSFKERIDYILNELDITDNMKLKSCKIMNYESNSLFS